MIAVADVAAAAAADVAVVAAAVCFCVAAVAVQSVTGLITTFHFCFIISFFRGCRLVLLSNKAGKNVLRSHDVRRRRHMLQLIISCPKSKCSDGNGYGDGDGDSDAMPSPTHLTPSSSAAHQSGIVAASFGLVLFSFLLFFFLCFFPTNLIKV